MYMILLFIILNMYLYKNTIFGLIETGGKLYEFNFLSFLIVNHTFVNLLYSQYRVQNSFSQKLSKLVV